MTTQIQTDTLLLNICDALKRAGDYAENGESYKALDGESYKALDNKAQNEIEDRICDAMRDLENRIAETPATTPEGLRAKFRVFSSLYGDARERWDSRLWDSFAHDIEHLGDAS